MQQIADWLESLGMSEYTQGFAENSIDISVLRDLTDQDPKRPKRGTRGSPENAAGNHRAGLRATGRTRGGNPSCRQCGRSRPPRLRRSQAHERLLASAVI
jgi:SAM domain (Sterile alpha motif)